MNTTTSLDAGVLSTNTNYLRRARVYLSGPMGFVSSRIDEKNFGWRNRVKDILNKMEVTVFDPWFKPPLHGLEISDDESNIVVDLNNKWSFEQTLAACKARADCAEQFRLTMNTDLRMVDTSDFIIAYCPTSIYSVGTLHEIVRAREQLKPVLFVSPPVVFPALDLLSEHLKNDEEGLSLLDQLIREVPIKKNQEGVPSAWYMSLIGNDTFFDGFGFKNYAKEFNWKNTLIDRIEDKYPPKNPLLPYLETLAKKIPTYWDDQSKEYKINKEWLLWNLDSFYKQKSD